MYKCLQGNCLLIAPFVLFSFSIPYAIEVGRIVKIKKTAVEMTFEIDLRSLTPRIPYMPKFFVIVFTVEVIRFVVDQTAFKVFDQATEWVVGADLLEPSK